MSNRYLGPLKLSPQPSSAARQAPAVLIDEPRCRPPRARRPRQRGARRCIVAQRPWMRLPAGSAQPPDSRLCRVLTDAAEGALAPRSVVAFYNEVRPHSARSDAGLNHAAAVLAAVKTASRRLRRWPSASLDTGGEFKRRRGATLIRAMTFPCNNDSRQSRLRVFSIFLSSATGKHSRIAPRTSSL